MTVPLWLYLCAFPVGALLGYVVSEVLIAAMLGPEDSYHG